MGAAYCRLSDTHFGLGEIILHEIFVYLSVFCANGTKNRYIMEISFNWLKKYIDLDISAEETATILTDIGLEVEDFRKVETIRGGLAGVVVGEIVECEDHPDSDHLHVTSVDVGGEAPLRIVCGAPNCRKGLKVLCATIGAVLYPNGGDEHIMRSSDESLRSTPSSVTKGVPSAQLRTTTLRPSILSASKACRGCPSSKRT